MRFNMRGGRRSTVAAHIIKSASSSLAALQIAIRESFFLRQGKGVSNGSPSQEATK